MGTKKERIKILKKGVKKEEEVKKKKKKIFEDIDVHRRYDIKTNFIWNYFSILGMAGRQMKMILNLLQANDRNCRL